MIKDQGCLTDPCISRKPTDSECGSLQGCVVKVIGDNQFCISGTCEDLTGSTNCEINGKCVSSKKACILNECKGLSEKSCMENKLCLVDNNNDCAFDLCSEGSQLDDGGVTCSSLSGCGYESYDDICKVSTSTFTDINVGSIQGVVCFYIK
jgi:hypothetical protein